MTTGRRGLYPVLYPHDLTPKVAFALVAVAYLFLRGTWSTPRACEKQLRELGRGFWCILYQQLAVKKEEVQQPRGVLLWQRCQRTACRPRATQRPSRGQVPLRPQGLQSKKTMKAELGTGWQSLSAGKVFPQCFALARHPSCIK